MALGACSTLAADCAVSTTGVAGPTEQEGQPVGSVWLGWCIGDEAAAVPVRLPGDRARIRQYASISVQQLLRQHLITG